MRYIDLVEKRGKCKVVIVKKGVGLETPNEGATCTVRLKELEQSEIPTGDIEQEIVIGEGDSEISETLDTCLLCMHQGEIWQVLLQNKHDESKDENNPGSLPSAELTTAYEVQLLSFAKAKEVWQTSSEEKVQLASRHKARGAELYKENRWLDASRRYSRALKQLILTRAKVSDDQIPEYNQLKLSCHLNLAACQGRLEQFDNVVQNCTKVLTMDKENIKALYRRGQAFVMLNELDKAKQDLETALALEPGNRAVREQLALLKAKQRQHDAAYSKALSAMFGRA